jgi:predicted DNA-binding ribbon-helix-helix protein
MKSPVVKRSIVIAGHKTSVSLEDAFWQGLKQIATERNLTLSDLVATIDTDRRQGNLSSAIRLFVLDYYRSGASATRTGTDIAPSDPLRESRPTRPATSALRSE